MSLVGGDASNPICRKALSLKLFSYFACGSKKMHFYIELIYLPLKIVAHGGKESMWPALTNFLQI